MEAWMKDLSGFYVIDMWGKVYGPWVTDAEATENAKYLTEENEGGEAEESRKPYRVVTLSYVDL